MNLWRVPLAAAAAVVMAAGPTVPAPASAATRGDFKRVSLPFFWPSNSLRDVDAASPDSVWITGSQGEITLPGPIPGTGTSIPGNPVVRRWQNGDWVEYDLLGLPGHGGINDVDAVGPEDVWINGTDYDAKKPYVAHFSGSAFNQVALPPGITAATLQADASGVWLSTLTDVYRWTGDIWTDKWTHVTAFPEISLDTGYIRADDDIWRLGTTSEWSTTFVAQHWDGQSWKNAPIHADGLGVGFGFTDMVALSPTDAWAVGTDYGTSPASAVLMHWDGTAWTKAAVPAGLNALTRIIKGVDGDLWALGHNLDEPAKPGLLHYSGGTWSRVPTTAVPNRTNIYATALAVVPGTGALWTLGTVNIGGPVVLTDG
ncbi:hypothetical protein [Actinomadura sp. NPDC048394]|jgi:hypothetical protein|uniref:hypothetical protein n=1 Tax=Actinomadura sp. NPDC048394 TaxID=3158223 RepID=UPI0033F04689